MKLREVEKFKIQIRKTKVLKITLIHFGVKSKIVESSGDESVESDVTNASDILGQNETEMKNYQLIDLSKLSFFGLCSIWTVFYDINNTVPT